MALPTKKKKSDKTIKTDEIVKNVYEKNKSALPKNPTNLHQCRGPFVKSDTGAPDGPIYSCATVGTK